MIASVTRFPALFCMCEAGLIRLDGQNGIKQQYTLLRPARQVVALRRRARKINRAA